MEIAAGEVLLLAEDESDLVGGDMLGSAWGPRNERIEVPIENVRQRQTYYGITNLDTQQVIVVPYDRGDGENTVAFMKYLQTLYPNKKLILLWHGASYHDGREVQAYLKDVNHDLEEQD